MNCPDFCVAAVKLEMPFLIKLEVLALVQRILDSKRMKVTISHGWWDSFRKRHPEFVLRVPAPVSLAQSKATEGSATILNHVDGSSGFTAKIRESSEVSWIRNHNFYVYFRYLVLPRILWITCSIRPYLVNTNRKNLEINPTFQRFQNHFDKISELWTPRVYL